MTGIESGVQLLVEGEDQQNFFKAFMDHLSLGDEDIQIQNFGGVAENKPVEEVRKSIRSSLRNTDPPIDDSLVKTFILPDNENKGMLETLLCRTFKDTDENYCIDSFLECVGNLPGNYLKRYDKACAHAFLATREEPHVSVGVAAQKGYWCFNHDAFADIGLFLRNLQK